MLEVAGRENVADLPPLTPKRQTARFSEKGGIVEYTLQ